MRQPSFFLNLNLLFLQMNAHISNIFAQKGSFASFKKKFESLVRNTNLSALLTLSSANFLVDQLKTSCLLLKLKFYSLSCFPSLGFPSERSNKVATVPKVCVYHTLNFHRLAKTLPSAHSHRRRNQANMLTCTFHLDLSMSPMWISQNLFMVFLFIAIIWYLGWCNKYMRTSRM